MRVEESVDSSARPRDLSQAQPRLQFLPVSAAALKVRQAGPTACPARALDVKVCSHTLHPARATIS